MKTAHVSRLAAGFTIVAGATDLATGILLVAAPALALRLMRVPVPGSEALGFVRFVGAFVAAVGAMYLWASRRPRERLRVVLTATLLPRLFAGTFVAAAVASGGWPPAWLSVTATDYGYALIQVVLLAKGLAG